MIIMGIEDGKRHIIRFLGCTNGKECTRTSSNMLNHVKNVNGALESDMKNPFIRHGALLFGKRSVLMSYICQIQVDMNILHLQGMI